MFGIIDDTTLICPLSVVLDTFVLHEAKLKEIGLSINRTKCKIYLRPHLWTTANIERCAALGIQLGTLPGQDETATYGVKVGGVPFGEPQYVDAFLDKQASKLSSAVTSMCSSLANTVPPNPSRPCNQALWVLCTRSIQHRASYFLRHIPPPATSSFADTVDSSIMKALLQSSGIDFGSCSTIVQQRLRLPHFLKGAGIRLQSFRRHLDYLGGLAQGLPPLLDKHDKTGNISTVGRLNSHSLVSLFGESSFDLDCTTPWKHLLDQHPTTSFATAIRDCHAALTNAYDTASAPVNPTATTTILVESLGCGPKGNLLISPTSTLTKELEEHQYSMLEQFVFSLPDSSQIPIMEQLAMINCDHYSTAEGVFILK